MTTARDVALRGLAIAARRLLPPLLAFLGALTLMWHAARGIKVDFFFSNYWNQWDAGLYLSIAKVGYTFRPCDTGWCGNAGWMPGFPWMIVALRTVSKLPLPDAGMAIVTAFHLGTLLLLWNGFLEAKVTFQNVLTLAYAGVFPGVVYQHALFPIAQFTFLVLLSLWLARKEKWVLAGLAGAFAAFTYSTGVVLAVVYGLWVIVTFAMHVSAADAPWRTTVKASWRRYAVRFAKLSVLTVLGFCAMMLVMQYQVGAWNAAFKVQAKYGIFSNVLLIYVDKVRAGFAIVQGAPLDDNVPGIQTLVVSLVALGLAYCAEKYGWWRDAQELLLLLFFFCMWSVPFSVSMIASHRAEAYLVPAVLLTRKFPIVIQVLLLIVAALSVEPVTRLYLKAVIA